MLKLGAVAPGLVSELIHGRFSDAEFDFFGIGDGPDRHGGGPAVVAVAADINTHDTLVIHCHQKMVKKLAAVDKFV